jgi:PAS domain S-box-containing protein/putative nucleotidyltransferase with HDIG domain
VFSINTSRILIIDDDADLLNALCGMLTGAGYEAIGFSSGAQALKAFVRQEFDVVLTDLAMPEMDGTELLKKLHSIDPDLICIIMAGQSSEKKAMALLKQEAFDIILKPFKLNYLLSVLTRALEVCRLRKENARLRETVDIYERCRNIASEIDLNAVLNNTAEAVLDISHTEEMSVMLPSNSGNELYIAVIRGKDRSDLLETRIPVNKGIAGWVASHRETLTLQGKIDDPRFSPVQPRSDIGSSISMPLLAKEKFVGVLNVNSTQNKPFSLQMIRHIGLLACATASALVNSSKHKELLETEQKYRLFFENGFEGFFQIAPDGKLLAVNRTMAGIFGYSSPEEMICREKDFNRWDFWPDYRRLLDCQNELRNYEHCIQLKNGRKIWVSANMRTVKDACGNTTYYEGTLQDITVRKYTEEELVRTRDCCLTLLEEFPTPVWRSGPEADFDYFNKTWRQFTGRTMAEELGNGWTKEIHPEDRESFFETYREASSTRKTFNCEFRLRRYDGAYCRVISLGKPFYDAKGNFAGYIGFCYDLSSYKKADDDYLDTIQKLETILNETITAFSLTSEKRALYEAGHHLRVTELACSIAASLGFEENRTKGLRTACILHDIGKIYIPTEILGKPGKLNDYEFNLVKNHSREGFNILKNISFSWPVAQIVLQHHERLNGSGYPFGLSCNNILQEAKILAVADVVEAMTSRRPYRPAFSLKAALEEISLKKGTLYDSHVVDQCIRLFLEEGFTF